LQASPISEIYYIFFIKGIKKIRHAIYFAKDLKIKSRSKREFLLNLLRDFERTLLLCEAYFNCIFKINSAPALTPSTPYPFSPYAHFPNSFHIIKSVQKFHIFIPFNNIYSLILVVIFKIKSVPNRDKVQDEQGKVSRVKG